MTTPMNRKSPNAPGFYMVSYTWDSSSAIKQEFNLPMTVNATNTGNMWTVEIDNTLNADPVYLKFWWMPEASVTVGSTPPYQQFVAPGSTKQTYTFCSGPPMTDNSGGSAYSNQVTWGLTLEGGTLGVNLPVGAVAVRLLYSES